MATVLTASLPAADVKIRFLEPYVSAGLNQKGTGIIPPGVYRGFIPSVMGLTLKLLAEAAPLGDSVAVADTLNASDNPNNFNVTVRHEGDVVLDFTGVLDGVYFIVLEVKYDIVSATPLSGITEVRIKAVTSVVPQHVILTRVTKAGVLLTLDDSVRMATGGPLVTPVQLSTFLDVLKVTNKPHYSPSQGLPGSFVDVTGSSVTFTTSAVGFVIAIGNAILKTGSDGLTIARFVLDGSTTDGSSLIVGGQVTASPGSANLLAHAGGAFLSVFPLVGVGNHTMKVQARTTASSGSIEELSYVLLHK